MKNYQVDEKQVRKSAKIKNEEFIKDLQFIENEGKITTINVILGNNTSFPVPYTIENLENLRAIMKEQGRKMQALISSKKIERTGWRVIGALSLTGTALVIISTAMLDREISESISNIIIGSSGVLASGIGEITSSNAISYIQKVGLFIAHDVEINKFIVANPWVYSNVNGEDKLLIEDWIKNYPEQPIVIENLDDLKNETISIIWKNIKLTKKFGIQIGVEEQGFQKTLGQV